MRGTWRPNINNREARLFKKGGNKSGVEPRQMLTREKKPFNVSLRKVFDSELLRKKSVITVWLLREK